MVFWKENGAAPFNVDFASAMFGNSIRYVAVSVLPAVLAIVLGVMTISALPLLATWLPGLFGLSAG